jgi:hypothetical protein
MAEVAAQMNQMLINERSICRVYNMERGGNENLANTGTKVHESTGRNARKEKKE